MVEIGPSFSFFAEQSQIGWNWYFLNGFHEMNRLRYEENRGFVEGFRGLGVRGEVGCVRGVDGRWLRG